MLRVCVIGMGPIGNRHADMYKADPLAELIGVCDIRKDRAEAAATRLGVPAFLDAQKMLDTLKPDLCSITTAGVRERQRSLRAYSASLCSGLSCSG